MILSAIVQTLAQALADGLSINAYSYGPDAPQSPAAFIYPDGFDFHYEFPHDGEKIDARFIVRFLVNATGESSQYQILEFISNEGVNSAVTLLEATSDGSLSIQVVSQRNSGVITMPDTGTRYHSAELVVSVIG